MKQFDDFLHALQTHMHERDINCDSCTLKSGVVEIFLENHHVVPQDKKELFLEKLLIVNGFVVGLQYRKSSNDLWKTMPNFCFERSQEKEENKKEQ